MRTSNNQNHLSLAKYLKCCISALWQMLRWANSTRYQQRPYEKRILILLYRGTFKMMTFLFNFVFLMQKTTTCECFIMDMTRFLGKQIKFELHGWMEEKRTTSTCLSSIHQSNLEDSASKTESTNTTVNWEVYISLANSERVWTLFNSVHRATCSRWPCLSMGVGPDDFLRVLSASTMILWYIKCKVTSYLICILT